MYSLPRNTSPEVAMSPTIEDTFISTSRAMAITGYSRWGIKKMARRKGIRARIKTNGYWEFLEADCRKIGSKAQMVTHQEAAR
jgi:hypothetical protein